MLLLLLFFLKIYYIALYEITLFYILYYCMLLKQVIVWYDIATGWWFGTLFLSIYWE